MNLDDYDEETLAVICPECCAAVTAKCLERKPGGMGGMIWIDAPHRARVLKAHGKTEDSIRGGVSS
jgi:hypothetical protein